MKNLKKVLAYLSIAIVAGVLALLLSRVAVRLKAQYGNPTYSVTLRMDVYNLDGTLSGSKLRFIGQRSNGDWVEVQPLSTSVTALTDPSVAKNYVIKFNWRGLTVQKNSVNDLISTTGDGKPRLPAPIDPVCDNYTNGKVISSEEIKGFVTVHTAVITKDEKSEYWTAPSLGCVVLKESRQFLDQGQWTGRTVTEAISASTQEPPASYFEIPANSKEARPTEYITSLTPGVSPVILNRMEMKYDRDKASRAQ